MIDWELLAANALWIFAAAIALSALSYRHWSSRREAACTATARPDSALIGLAVAVATAEPAIVLVMAPALLFPSPLRLGVLAAVPLLLWANRRVSGRAIPLTPLNASLCLLLGMTALSLGATFDILNSLGKVSGVVLGALVFWAWTRWTNTPARLSIATRAFLLAGATLAVVGLLGTNWFGKFGFLAPIVGRLPRAIQGVPGAEEGFQPNAVAGCLVLFIPLQIALIAREWRTAKPLVRAWFQADVLVQLAMLALTTGTLVLTQSRGAWSGMAVAFVVFLLWYRRWTRAMGVLLLAGLGGLAVWMGPNRLADMAISQSGPAMTQNVVGRVELWSRAIDAIHDFPFTGMGMNSFRRLMPTMYPTLASTPKLDVAHAHNHLLQAALDLGIPGLIAYLAIWMTASLLLLQAYRRSADPLTRAIAGGIGAGLIAHFVFGLADVIPLGSKVGILFWATLAMAVSLHQVTAGTGGSARPLEP